MKLRTLACLLTMTFVSAFYGAIALGQVSPDEEQMLEEEFFRSKLEHGQSHASGNRDDLGPVILGNPTQAVIAIRVGIHYSYTATGAFSEFSSLHHPFVRLSNTEGDVKVIDRSTGQEIAVIQPGQIVEVSYTNASGYMVTGPAGTVTVAGPVRFMPELPTNYFRIESIRRLNPLVSGSPQTVPLYRGAIEVSRGTATLADRVNLMNIIEVERYVRGVVAE